MPKRKLTTIATIPWQGSTPPPRKAPRKKVSGPVDQTNVVPFVLPAKVGADTDFTVEDKGVLWVFTAVSQRARENLYDIGIEPFEYLPLDKFIMSNWGGAQLEVRLIKAGWTVEMMKEL